MQNYYMDHTWKDNMNILMKRMKRIEVAEKIDEAIWNWYFANGKEVPDWKVDKDPQWWTNYLRELSGDYEENDDW